MEDKSLQMQLGIGAIIASLLLLFIIIPFGVSAPATVRNIVLSPLFWPNVVAGLTGIVGLGMILLSVGRSPAPSKPASDVSNRGAAFLRLAIAAALMIATMYALPRIGMVWVSMLLFALVAFLVRTTHPKTALVCAVLLPLLLYVFFAHVAGVAIPQGNFVRLP